MPETCLGAAWRQKKCRSFLKLPYKFSDGRTISIQLVRRVRRISCQDRPLEGQQINAYFSTKPRNRLLICLGQLIFSFSLFSFSLFHHKKTNKQTNKKTKKQNKGQEYRNSQKKFGEGNHKTYSPILGSLRVKKYKFNLHRQD